MHLENDMLYVENIKDDFAYVKRRIKEIISQNGGVMPDMIECYSGKEIKDTAPTITTSCSRASGIESVCVKEKEYRIRKLTPSECFKLMGLTSEDCKKARALGVSDSSLYKEAGNGIVTNCVEMIFEHIYKAFYDNFYICFDEDSREKLVSDDDKN